MAICWLWQNNFGRSWSQHSKRVCGSPVKVLKRDSADEQGRHAASRRFSNHHDSCHALNSIEDNGARLYGGEPAGFVVRLPGDFSLYHAGDTALFSDMKLIAELYHPQLAMLPIGDLFTMAHSRPRRPSNFFAWGTSFRCTTQHFLSYRDARWIAPRNSGLRRSNHLRLAARPITLTCFN